MKHITRKDFLRGGMAVGGMVAVARLPVFADKPSVFPQRGRWERLSIVGQHIEAGASKPFSILHISDTHLTAVYQHEDERLKEFFERRTKTFGGRQEEALRDSLAWAKEHVDYVIHTGDLIDCQSDANFDLVRKYYGESGYMMTGALGNHEYYHRQPKQDENEDGKAKTRGRLAAAYPFDLSISSTVVNGVNFVTLDNVYGTVTPEQVVRFEAEAKKGLPIILCMHCPISTARIWCAASKYWKANPKEVPDMNKWRERRRDAVTKDFVAYLRAQPLLKAILAGHIHVSVQDRFSPTAMEYVVGGNFLFHGQEITFS